MHGVTIAFEDLLIAATALQLGFGVVTGDIRHFEQIPGLNGDSHECEFCDTEAARIVSTFLDRIPAVREVLATDVQAAFDGDPAAQSTDETIFSYPGLFACSARLPPQWPPPRFVTASCAA